MSQKNLLHVIIDKRERKLMEVLDRKKDKITYESKQLEIADILISNEVAIERKEGFDFIASIKDNRLFEQLLRLKETYITAILIIEGLNDMVFENTGMNINSILGALSFVSYKLGISVIPTRHLEDTAIVIERIAYREQVKDDMPLLYRSAPKKMSLQERRYFMMESLVDIGPKKARLLIDTFKTPYDAISAIKSTKIKYTRNGNPKGISGIIKQKGLKGFSWKFIKNNQELLFGKINNDKQKIINEVIKT